MSLHIDNIIQPQQNEELCDKIGQGGWLSHPFPQHGFIFGKLTEEQLKPLHDEANKIKSNFDSFKDNEYNKNLVGYIEREYCIPDQQKHIEDILLPMCFQYDEIYGSFIRSQDNNTQKRPLRLVMPWMNFQRKYEFNPPHSHDGVFSYVIWLNIPYTMEEERKNPSGTKGTDSNNKPGTFSFMYHTSLGVMNQMTIPVDKSFNGCYALFPAKTIHYVNPFYTSDDFRITISGNFMFDTQ